MHSNKWHRVRELFESVCNLELEKRRARLDEICDGFREAIDREVETLRREGLPIYVDEAGRVIDLQDEVPRR